VEALRELPVTKDWNLTNQTTDKLYDLKAKLNQEIAFTISNGSFCKKNLVAWIIEGKNQSHRLIGICMTQSCAADHSSFCSKLWGLYGYYSPFFPKPSIRKNKFFVGS